MQPVSSLNSKTSSAFKPFSSSGTQKSRVRCKCNTSLLVAPSCTEEEKLVRQQPASTVASRPSEVQVTKGGATSLGHTGELNNILPRSQLGQTANACTQDVQAQLPVKSGPGRPKGIPAWNKGKRMSDTAKKRLSKAQKKRWKQQPALRATVSSKLKGKEPWNKGLELSYTTRRKMSTAKLGQLHRQSVRKRMRRAHLGFRHTEESKALMSAVATGVPKRFRHRASIANAQRRRHATRRILAAVEAFHRGAESATLSSGLTSPSSKPSQGTSVRGRGMQSRVRSLSSRDSQTKGLTKTQVMTAYKVELHEYRALQEELGPWTTAFREQHGRKPGLRDVQDTGIPWLLEKFKAYVFLRERLLTDTTILRGKLEDAAPEVAQASANAGKATGLKAASYSTKLNANAGLTQRSKAQSAATLTAALEYRRQQQALADTAAASASAAAAARAAPADAMAAETSESRLPGATADGGSNRLQQSGAGSSDQQLQHAAVSSNGTQHAQRAQHAKSNLKGAQQSGATASSNGSGTAAGLDAGNGPHLGQNAANSPALASNGSSSISTHSSRASAVSLGSNQHPNGTKSEPQDLQPASGNLDAKSQQSGTNLGDEGALPEASQNGKSSAAMADALARIRSQKPTGKPLTSAGERALPTPTPGTAPRVKNALLAAQEYRKQKAAKTAALAVAAAQAAAEAAKKSNNQHN